MEEILLNNGIKIPNIGFGTFPQKDSLVESVNIAYSSGYFLYDTSDNYFNEEFLGKAIENKDGITIISKFSQPYRTFDLEKCFDESEKKLENRLDIYLLHWPYPFLWKEQWRRMEKLYFDGKCKGIGVCNFDVEKIEQLLSFCKVKPVINQIERHPLFQQREIVEYCKSQNIAVMSYSPTARQDKELFESELLNKLSVKYNKSINQVILRWDIDTGTIPIPGSKSEKHIRENIDVDGFELTNEELIEISKLDNGKRIRFDPRKRFSKKEILKFAIYRFLKKKIV